MTFLSKRINNLSESQTIKMAKLGRELTAKGIDVINLSFGEPDFFTPEHVKEAAKKAVITLQFRDILNCVRLLLRN
jgi:aspartate aminotransferase